MIPAAGLQKYFAGVASTTVNLARVGGFLGLGEKNVAVDYDYLQKNGSIAPNRITLGLSEQDLRNAPAFQRASSSSSNQ